MNDFKIEESEYRNLINKEGRYGYFNPLILEAPS